MCVDKREDNKAIIRERHVLPTVEELIHDLNNASIFNKIDLSKVRLSSVRIRRTVQIHKTFSTLRII